MFFSVKIPKCVLAIDMQSSVDFSFNINVLQLFIPYNEKKIIILFNTSKEFQIYTTNAFIYHQRITNTQCLDLEFKSCFAEYLRQIFILI